MGSHRAIVLCALVVCGVASAPPTNDPIAIRGDAAGKCRWLAERLDKSIDRTLFSADGGGDDARPVVAIHLVHEDWTQARCFTYARRLAPLAESTVVVNCRDDKAVGLAFDSFTAGMDCLDVPIRSMFDVESYPYSRRDSFAIGVDRLVAIVPRWRRRRLCTSGNFTAGVAVATVVLIGVYALYVHRERLRRWYALLAPPSLPHPDRSTRTR